MYVSSRKPQYHRGSSIDFLNLRGHLALFGKKKVLLNEAMVSNKSNVCKCQQVSKEKYARMNPKTIKLYALCLNTNEVIFVCLLYCVFWS